MTGPCKKWKTIVVGKPEEIPDDGNHDNDDQGGGSSKQSCDPNEVAGPEGVGERRLVKPGERLDYTIYFENKEGFDIADAQEVLVTNLLDAHLDWSTFEMGEIAFGSNTDLGLDGLNAGTSEAAYNGTARKVRTELSVGKDGVASWYMRIVDPDGTFGWPEDGSGFLPFNDDTHRGEGHLTYRIKVRDDAPYGVVITNSATIVFDYNDLIETDPSWWNTDGEFRTLTLSLEDAGTTNLTFVAGEKFGVLPTPTRAGYAFRGWFFGPNGTGDEVTAETIVPSGLANIYANWEANAAPVDPAPITPDPAPVDPTPITPEPVNPTPDGPTPTPDSTTEPDVQAVSASEITQSVTVKKAAVVQGCVIKNDSVVGSVEIKVAAEGKKGSKVSGSVTLLGGKKLTAKTTDSKLTVKLSEGPAVVDMTVKGLGQMSIKIGGLADGSLAFTGTLDGGYIVTSAAVGGEVSKNAKFYLTGEVPSSINGAGVNTDYLPKGEPVSMNGKKWTLSKAVTIKYAKDKTTKEYGWIVNNGKDDPTKSNWSGLKLTYTPKTGAFKGSFTIYTLNGTKMKKVSAKVTGIVVDGVGYGKVTAKGIDDISALVE